MGVSTDGLLVYGFVFDDGQRFPWNDDIDDWWLIESGFKQSKECYDSKGNELPGITKADTDAYFDERRAWRKSHPCPVAPVNYCSGDYPMYILACGKSDSFYAAAEGYSASRGFPVKIDPSELLNMDEQRQVLIDFCTKYGIDIEGKECAWWLASYWG